LKLELRAITSSNVNCDSAVMMSSHYAVGKIRMRRIAASDKAEPTMKEKFR
jgi:hypothetical protein